MRPIPATDTIGTLQSRRQHGTLSCQRLTEDALAGARAAPAQAVFTRIYDDAALAAARAADAAHAAGIALPALAGLPVTIKDLYDVAGETTLAGSVVCRDDPPASADAPAVARLRAHGAAILGKTNMTEFAFSGVGINPHYGTPRNPLDAGVARIPGGSSSGAAVSVALGLAVAGLGSDTGGSIRIPAALNGLVGFKPTQSRVPLQGAYELSRTLDTVCAMTRCVEDCLLVDAVIADTPLQVRRRPLAGMRFAVPGTLLFDAVEPAVAAAVSRALSRLSQAGALLVDLQFAELAEIAQINTPVGFAAIEAHAKQQHRLETHRAQFDQRVAQRIAGGGVASAADYLRLHDRRQHWISRAEALLQGFDAVLCPTVPLVAPPIDSLADDAAFFRVNGLLLRNPSAFNFLDGCSFSLPCHLPGEPAVGLMLSSVRGDDARLAAVALAVEAALAPATA